MDDSTRLIRDATERYKLKVSLPGGRYQLSLDDRAVILLTNELGYSERDKIPNQIVPILVAMGDAWFPRERDVDRIIDDLPVSGHFPAEAKTALQSYLTSSYVQKRNVSRVLEAVDRIDITPVSKDDLKIKSLPSLPDSVAAGSKNNRASTQTDDSSTSEAQTQVEDVESASGLDDENIHSRFEEIPGIGPKRANQLVAAEISSLAELAELRPTDLASQSQLSEGPATVAIEGARELSGKARPMGERLKAQTGVSAAEHNSALSSLAAAGVPPSEAASNLRVIYGPTVGDIDDVSGIQAYFLWEAGYQTPKDIAEASLTELESIYQVGSTTAPKIRASARDLLDSFE